MVVATLMGNAAAHSLHEYLAALLLCLGTGLFSSGGARQGSAEHHPAMSLLLGCSLLSFSVLAEGVLPNVQQAIMRRGVSPDTLTFRVNAIGAIAGGTLLLASGDVWRLGAYAQETPAVLPLLLASGMLFSFSIMSYTRLIDEAGSVFTVGVSTLRKSLTVLLSFLLFPGKAFNAFR
eukprot:CAMPEP_0168475864 /NCGR_PEP_ID=MMETSP0228-20121227/61588_1 /TAXON_ID=133427 /ORGANISM="Protoceratium reticulatum, Strain CCCM 535 (=CCMP 1889)" /LENGTH=176 /DNA_ID=CAMNT_0008491959 /DNA_START=13 /DNA_END=540 /DNA_ORIENTATION=-